MPDLTALLLRKSIDALAGDGGSCSQCERTPVPGERLHEMDTGRVLCDLCLVELPEEDRRAVRSERVGAMKRRLAVVPKAA
jgi:hypothetical protein